MSGPVVAAVELHKRYPDGDGTADAVVDVSLTLGAGELIVLAGPSGSGKSTLLALLGGLLTPTSGDVELLGQSVVHMRDHHRAAFRRSHVGFVFQELGLLPTMTLLDNILLPLAPTGGEGPKDVSRALEALRRFGLADRAHTPVARLSGGERQRGAVVRALVHDPELLLLDEPTAHIDADNAAEMIRLLAELRDEGRTILAATHDPRLIDDPQVDRVLTMRGGAFVDPDPAPDPSPNKEASPNGGAT